MSSLWHACSLATALFQSLEGNDIISGNYHNISYKPFSSIVANLAPTLNAILHAILMTELATNLLLDSVQGTGANHQN